MKRIVWIFVAASIASCADKGAVAPNAPASAPPSATASLPPMVSARAGETASAELAWTVPAGWVEEQPSSSMRRAQYRVPGTAGDGECAVFYFGPGQGGDAMSNAQRWAGQFKGGALKTSTLTVGTMSVLLVEVAGTYDGGMTMTAAPSTPKPGYALLGAIAEGPDANWFFKLTGPEATIAAQHDAFLSMIRSLK